MSRSNWSSTTELVATPVAPLDGLIEATIGGPTVRNSNGPAGFGAGLPAVSTKPGSTVTLNSVADGSFWAGVKIAVVPRSQVNVPPTYGSIRKRCSTDDRSTGSLKLRSIAVSVWARWSSPLGGGAQRDPRDRRRPPIDERRVEQHEPQGDDGDDRDQGLDPASGHRLTALGGRGSRGRTIAQHLYCRTCEPAPSWVSLRGRRDTCLDPRHLPRHPELRRPAVPGPAEVDGEHAPARRVRPGRQAHPANRRLRPGRRRGLLAPGGLRPGGQHARSSSG